MGHGEDDDMEMPSPIQEIDERGLREEDEEEGRGRIEEVVLEDEDQADVAQVLKQDTTTAPEGKGGSTRRPKVAKAKASSTTTTKGEGNSSAPAPPASKTPPTLAVSSTAANGADKTVTTASGVSKEMMRVALAAWGMAEQGPTEEALTEEDIENAEAMQSPRDSYPDPQTQKFLLSGRVNQAVVILNIGFGIVYLCWRVFRSMNPNHNWRDWAPVGHYFVDPEDPERAWSVLEELKYNWFCWLLFIAEILLMVAIWLGHPSRCFPSKR